MSENRLRALCNNKETQGPAVIKLVSTPGAIKRGVKSFFLALIGGIFITPIPGAHIVGILLLVAAPIAGFVVFFKSRGMIEGMSGSFDCPSCGTPNVMEYQEGKPPFYGSCVSCKNPYQVFPLA